MNATRRLTLIIGSVLALAAIIALQASRFSPVLTQTDQPAIGIGNLRYYEAQQSSSIAGMGDLRRYEAAQSQPIIPVTGMSGSNQLDIGMGNLRRFEGEQVAPATVIPQSNLPIVPIVDMIRSVHSDKVSMTSSEVASKGPGR